MKPTHNGPPKRKQPKKQPAESLTGDKAFIKAKGNGMGRPTKLTDDLRENIALLVGQGNYIETAAAYCGISKVTLYTWMRLGHKEDEGPHRDFLNAVTKAEATGEMQALRTISAAGEKAWQALAWRLERKFPDRWGRRDRMEISGPGGGPVQVMQAQLDISRLMMENPDSARQVRALIEMARAKLLPAGET